MSTVVLSAGAVATTTIAGAAKQPAADATPIPLNVQLEFPLQAPTRKTVHPRHRKHVASRAHARHALVGSPREMARVLAARRGWGNEQFSCLDRLWTRESHWQVHAHNQSGA